MVREIYADYTDQIEPFGLDEAWMDVTASATLRGDGQKIADEIRLRVREELGLTGSVGVADNKIFAKLGSDMKKPDATTVITRQNYRDTVWRLPVEELLYVGRSTRSRLYLYNIMTIGDLATCDRNLLHANMGKWGETLWTFANGLDASPVMAMGEESVIKSIGNSTTTPRDLVDDADVKMTMCVLAESVAARLREHGLKCSTVQIHVRDNELNVFERQAKLPRPSQLSSEIATLSMELFRDNYRWARPIRSLGVRGTDLVDASRRQAAVVPAGRRAGGEAHLARKHGGQDSRAVRPFQHTEGADAGRPAADRPQSQGRPCDTPAVLLLNRRGVPSPHRIAPRCSAFALASATPTLPRSRGLRPAEATPHDVPDSLFRGALAANESPPRAKAAAFPLVIQGLGRNPIIKLSPPTRWGRGWGRGLKGQQVIYDLH